jgi:hypothetical protein
VLAVIAVLALVALVIVGLAGAWLLWMLFAWMFFGRRVGLVGHSRVYERPYGCCRTGARAPRGRAASF